MNRASRDQQTGRARDQGGPGNLVERRDRQALRGSGDAAAARAQRMTARRCPHERPRSSREPSSAGGVAAGGGPAVEAELAGGDFAGSALTASCPRATPSTSVAGWPPSAGGQIDEGVRLKRGLVAPAEHRGRLRSRRPFEAGAVGGSAPSTWGLHQPEHLHGAFRSAPPPRRLARRPGARGRDPGRLPRRAPRAGESPVERLAGGGRGRAGPRLAGVAKSGRRTDDPGAGRRSVRAAADPPSASRPRVA